MEREHQESLTFFSTPPHECGYLEDEQAVTLFVDPRVRPANEGMGAGGEQCLLCHKANNNQLTRIPGAQKWRMAPYSMSWDGLDAADICGNLKDREMNGDRDPAAIKHHLEHDKLVHWAWSPGTPRTTPPISYRKLLDLADQWVKAGAPCPKPPDE